MFFFNELQLGQLGQSQKPYLSRWMKSYLSQIKGTVKLAVLQGMFATVLIAASTIWFCTTIWHFVIRELLALGDQVGTVNTGLSEDALYEYLKQSDMHENWDRKCSICGVASSVEFQCHSEFRWREKSSDSVYFSRVLAWRGGGQDGVQALLPELVPLLQSVSTKTN
jgi:hypothetical protein